jgi:hypothetical protein
MVKVYNIQFYMLLVFVSKTWFLVLRKENILGAFNNSVMRRLNSSREEVTGKVNRIA